MIFYIFRSKLERMTIVVRSFIRTRPRQNVSLRYLFLFSFILLDSVDLKIFIHTDYTETSFVPMHLIRGIIYSKPMFIGQKDT